MSVTGEKSVNELKIPTLPSSGLPTTSNTPRSRRVYRVDASNVTRKPLSRRNSLPEVQRASTELEEAQAAVIRLEKENWSLRDAVAMQSMQQRGHNKFVSGSQFRSGSANNTPRGECQQCLSLKEKLKRQQLELEEARRELQAGQEEATERNASLQSERAARSSLASQVQELQSALAAAGALGNDTAALTARLDAASAKLKASEAECARLRAVASQGSQGEAELRAKLDAAMCAHKLQKGKAEARAGELQECKAELAAALKAGEALKAAVRDANGAKKALEGQVLELQHQLKGAAGMAGEASALRGELEALKKKLAAAEADRARLEGTLEDAWFQGGKAAALGAELEGLRKQLQEAKGEAGCLEASLQAERAAGAQAALELQAAEARLQAAEEDLRAKSQWEAAAQGLEQQVERLKVALKAAEEAAQTEREHFLERKAAQVRETELLGLQLKSATEDAERLRDELESARDASDREAADRAEGLRGELELARKQLMSSKTEVGKLKVRLEELTNKHTKETQSLNHTIAVKNSELGDSQDKLKAEEQRRRNLQEGKLAVERALSDSEAEVKRLRTEAAQLVEKAKKDARQTVEKMLESQVQVVVSAPCVRLAISGQNYTYRAPAQAVHDKIRCTLEDDVLPKYLHVFSSAVGTGHDAADKYASKFIADMTKEINAQIMPLIYKDLPKNVSLTQGKENSMTRQSSGINHRN